jgi:hypothetical protein
MLRDGVDRGSPLWLGALQMAEAWGVPPWVIMEAPGSLMWAARWAAYQKEKRWVEDNR